MLVYAVLILLRLVAVHFLFLPKKHPRILHAILCLLVAAAVCVSFDELIYRGSLDYLGVIFRTGEKQVGGHTHPLYSEIIFDLKDMYVWCAYLLLTLLLILCIIDYTRTSKERKKEMGNELKSKWLRLLPIKKRK